MCRDQEATIQAQEATIQDQEATIQGQADLIMDLRAEIDSGDRLIEQMRRNAIEALSELELHTRDYRSDWDDLIPVRRILDRVIG